MNRFHPVTLPIPLVAQLQPGECLAACAAMVLHHLRVPADFNQFVRHLGITDIGAPFSRLQRLETLGIRVTLERGALLRLHQHLVSGQPCIVTVETRELPYRPGADTGKGAYDPPCLAAKRAPDYILASGRWPWEDDADRATVRDFHAHDFADRRGELR